MSGPSSASVDDGGRKMLALVFTVVAIILAAVYGNYRFNRWWEKHERAEHDKEVATQKPPANKSSSNATTQSGRCSGSWDVHELELPAGGLPVDLCWGWSFWSINGPVTLTTRSGKVYRYLPGKEGTIVVPELQMGGVAIFRADPEGSQRKIAVKNQW